MLTREDVEKVAALARLEFTDDEIQEFTQQLGKIVMLVEELNEVATEGVEEMAHPLDVHTVLRDDARRSSLSREQALANSPSHDREFFLVPPVLGRNS
jgi:aspartyl-tRNA(Asn)/glutamyl-tRNA(Gln) amidotransferase subunit C